MAMLASEIMDRARRVIQDETSVRWPLPELRLWLNDGQREIVLHKPTALSASVAIPLSKGTYQSLPSQYTAILRVTRNLHSAQPRAGGRAIITVDREMLDAQNPDWHDERRVRQKAQVSNVCYEQSEPRAFWVYPGNDGTGIVEAIVARVPTPVPAPSAATENDLAAYNVPLDFDDLYAGALIDFVLYRAHSKDSQFAGSAARAAAHYQLFANAIGLKLTNERARNPNAKPPVQEENAA